jgi:hypothetical protein
MATFCGFFPSFFRRTRRAIPGLVVAAMLSGCNTGGSTPDTVQVSTPSTPGDPAPAPPPGGSNADTTSPTVSISSPASGSVVAGTVSVHADATDPVVAGQTTSGIAGVQLQVNGQNVGDLETGAPYSASFDTTSVADGVYQVRAIARDGAGNQTTSAAVAVTVRNASPPPTPPPSGTDTTKPTITIESPTTSSAYSATSASLTLGGKASDNIGVTQLTWSNNQGGSGNATLASGNWTAGNIALKANASNVITVTARDAAGNAQTDAITVSYLAASGGNAALSWNANIESDLAGYRVYYGESPGSYNQEKGSGIAVSGTSFMVTGLASGKRYFFTVTAYDSSGNESAYAQEVLKDIP